MDFVVQLPRTLSGHDAILVFVDRLTKMVCLVPTTSDCDAAGAAELFTGHVLAKHGWPTDIVSDRGSVFTSQFWQHLMKNWDVQHLKSTAYHPQTDGQTERTNRTMEDILRHYVSPMQNAWDKLLPMVEFAINNTRQDSTQETPFFLNYGRHPHTPVSVQLPRRQTGASDKVPAVARIAEEMQQALQKAKKCLEAARQRQKKYADTRRSPVTVKLGDQVLLSTRNIDLKNPGTKKLLPKWMGPFKIIQEINPVAFKLELPANLARLHPVFHANLLKPYLASGTVQPPPEPILIEDGDVLFLVDQLLDRRSHMKGRKRVTEYLVKWKGYAPEHNTWEPASNIEDPDLIKQFEAREQEALAVPALRKSARRNTNTR
jgi:hypothetical protein